MQYTQTLPDSEPNTETDYTPITEHEKRHFLAVERKQRHRTIQLGDRIIHYYKLIDNVYQYVMNRSKRNMHSQNTLRRHEEAAIIKHINYLRERISVYQDEICYLTGEGL